MPDLLDLVCASSGKSQSCVNFDEREAKSTQHGRTLYILRPKMTSKQSKAPAFEDREIDASMDLCCWLVLCPFTVGAIPYKTTIRLDAEGKTSKNRGVYCGCQAISLLVNCLY